MFAFYRTQGLMSQLLSSTPPATRRMRVRAIHTLSPRMRRVVFTGTHPTELADCLLYTSDAADEHRDV